LKRTARAKFSPHPPVLDFQINSISHFDKADGGFVVMIDGSKAPAASGKLDLPLRLIGEIM
jgi:hypothetical protein